MYKKIDMTGQIFDRLTVVDEGLRVGRHTMWVCRCKCGQEITTRRDSLVSGYTTSCGCRQREAATVLGSASTTKFKPIHGHFASPTYVSWCSMIQRCTNPNNKDWERYGGRGIIVCERWRNFTNFLADMGERPEGRTLDRIDNDGNYEPGNVRWATPHEQNMNRRRKPL